MSRAWKFGNNVNTDQIIPGRYYPRENLEELGQFCLCELRPEFAKGKKEGDVIVAGKNFGCGSSREYAPIALKNAGVKCVVAESFARIFLRNAINIGFPVLACGNCSSAISDGDDVSVDTGKGKIKNNSTGKEFHAEPITQVMREIINAGGLIEFLKKENAGEKK